MANRVEASEVIALFPAGSGLTDTVVDPFITTANTIVNNNLAGNGPSDEALTEIEKYISAHFVASTVLRQTQSKKVGDASETYAKLGTEYQSTTYGTIALQLDTSGLLAESTLRSPTFLAIETEYEDF